MLCVLALMGLIRWTPRVMAIKALDAYDNQAALWWLERSAWLWNDPGQVALERVRVYRRLRQFDLVRTHLLRAQAAGVSRDRLEHEQWLTLAQAGQLESIEAKLPSLLRDSDADPRDVCEAYVTGFLLTARSGQALELTGPWLADFPNDAQAHYLRGKAHAAGRHYVDAEQSFKKARELAPRRTDIALALAEALLELQQPQAALPLFEAATVDAGLRDRARLGVAQSARRSGQPEKALIALQVLVQDSPKLSAAWEELGRAQLDRKNLSAACASLEKAVELSPNSPSCRQTLGRALMAQGKPLLARPHLEFAARAVEATNRIRLLEDHAELNPRDAATRFEIAKLYRAFDTPDLATAWARSVLLIEPDHDGARSLLQDVTSETRSESKQP